MPSPHRPSVAVRRTLRKLGLDIRDARRRRRLPAEIIANRAFTSRPTLQRIEQGLKQGPQVLGYATQLWTAGRVAELIARECGVAYHPRYVGRILARLGWSCQRPVGRALERDEAAVRPWKRVRWPELKKKPENKGERSFSSTRAG